MPSPLSGPGVGLPLPQYLYPSELTNAPYDTGTNYVALAPGDALTVPAGTWYLAPGAVSLVQVLEPVTGIWRNYVAVRGQPEYMKSDGFTLRIANLTGCPIGAIVQNGGSAYVQATTTVTASTGGSTWQPIVGGQCSVVTINNPGSGLSIAPLVFIPPPPSPGVAATAYATLSAGTVSGVTLSNVGAGYLTAPTAAILPSQFDPNFGTTAIVNPTVTLGLTGAGKITAVLCTNSGTAQANATAPTLTAAGAGTAATIAAVMLSTVTGTSIAVVGAGYGTAELTTVGGVPSQTSAYTDPAIELTGFRPRPAVIGLTITGGTIAAVGTIYDSGLFAGVPAALVLTNGIVTTVGTVSLTLGGANDLVMLQPAP